MWTLALGPAMLRVGLPLREIRVHARRDTGLSLSGRATEELCASERSALPLKAGGQMDTESLELAWNVLQSPGGQLE